jgi:A/G-specific adenine glycosylase
VTPHQRKINTIVSKLLEWYPKNARDLPWRRTNDPYCVFVSEIMLQQTQVKTVIPYWERWMEALPNVHALAVAKPDRVLKLWEGLGYYSRAANLHKAAQMIVQKHGGIFPRTFSELMALPGIGRYTAGAICSIAFDQATPILDGNVLRVLARLYNIQGNPKSPRTNNRLWSLAEALVKAADQTRINGERPCADLNQALMELGATVCTPVAPQCVKCPVQGWCAGFARGVVHRLPRKAQRIPTTALRFVALVLEHKGKFLVRRRAANVVNGKLWEFPNIEIERRDTKSALASLAAPARVSPFLRVKHTITRYRITLDVFTAESIDPVANQPGQWCSLTKLQRLPFSSAHRKILDHLVKCRSQGHETLIPGAKAKSEA